MATDPMYLENLEEYVNDEGKIVRNLVIWFFYKDYKTILLIFVHFPKP